MSYTELSLNQRRHFIDTVQVYQSLRDAKSLVDRLSGSMYWKSVGGREYLTRDNGRGSQRGLGVRSPETERIHGKFHQDRERAKDRLAGLKNEMNLHARMAKAVRINRVPYIVAEIARRMADDADLSSRTLIVGTNSLYAYEAHAGVRFVTDVLATNDVDVLWDSRQELVLTGVDGKGFMALLLSVDPSFKRLDRQTYRAANDQGFMVDLIEPMSRDIMIRPHSSMDSPGQSGDDLIAASIKGLDWLVSCPKFHADVIDERGFPATMVVPDPRAFVLHKSWLAGRLDRDPVKRLRDRAQSAVVRTLIEAQMPDMDFSDRAIEALPQELRSMPEVRTEMLHDPRGELDDGPPIELLRPD